MGLRLGFLRRGVEMGWLVFCFFSLLILYEFLYIRALFLFWAYFLHRGALSIHALFACNAIWCLPTDGSYVNMKRNTSV
ncbi:hypothetical protein F4774DRAFT_113826 [Daldinia eschscholtzii]|nr:hypothetical protein F4774DRAFT_113826 [Daldinia eschscholtzii]